jgi:hypothetical protein
VLRHTIERYLKEFGKSLKFDFQQSANLYLLPLRTLVGLYHEGLQQVQHRPPRADSKIYDAAAPASQQQGQSAQRANFAFEVGLVIGSFSNSTTSQGSYIPAASIQVPLDRQPGHVLGTLQTQREAIDWAKNRGHSPLVALSAIGNPSQSSSRRAIA